MADANAVANHIQSRLRQAGLHEVAAVEAAKWLDEAGLLRDSPDRPGKPLRKLLRSGSIPNAEQRPPGPSGRWYIRRAGAAATAGIDHGPSPTPRATDESVRVARSVHRTSDEPESATTGPDRFTREHLSARGFDGFHRLLGISVDRIPQASGVYVVLREDPTRPRFLDRNPAGWFKGKDPTVPVTELQAAWPDGAQCVYIGKAGVGSTGRRGLRKRIQELRDYGTGRPVGHQGGRRIWQLADAKDFVIAWLPTPDEAPEAVEARLIAEFVAVHGKRPIGNRMGG